MPGSTIADRVQDLVAAPPDLVDRRMVPWILDRFRDEPVLKDVLVWLYTDAAALGPPEHAHG